jgi:hypothetical protein
MNIDLNNNNGSTEFLNFSEGLNHLRWGDRVARRGWQEGRYIQLRYPDMTILHFSGFGAWQTSQKDILAEDWYVV